MSAHPSLEMSEVADLLTRSTVQVRGKREPGGGSGVVWRSDGRAEGTAEGLIITNAHVARRDRMVVEFHDGRVVDAAVIARDPRRDLAALRVEAEGLVPVEVGDSDALRVGELVLAVGNPLGLVGALTTGIVHAVDEEEGQAWVRADVRLAPGNSGGPLADASGRVIGINSMINGNLALAVPSRSVERFVLGMRKDRPYLGVATRAVVVPETGFGLLGLQVEDGSPAARGGLLVGDVLLTVDGRPLRAPDSLLLALSGRDGGTRLRLSLSRGGRQMRREIDLEDSIPRARVA